MFWSFVFQIFRFIWWFCCTVLLNLVAHSLSTLKKSELLTWMQLAYSEITCLFLCLATQRVKRSGGGWVAQSPVQPAYSSLCSFVVAKWVESPSLCDPTWLKCGNWGILGCSLPVVMCWAGLSVNSFTVQQVVTWETGQLLIQTLKNSQLCVRSGAVRSLSDSLPFTCAGSCGLKTNRSQLHLKIDTEL